MAFKTILSRFRHFSALRSQYRPTSCLHGTDSSIKQTPLGLLQTATSPERGTASQEEDLGEISDVFRSKTLWDIVRAHFVLKVCKNDYFIDNSVKFYHKSQGVFGDGIVDYVTRKTFYDQFVGGDDKTSLETVACKLAAAGIGIQLAATIEDPADATLATRGWYDHNLTKLIKIAETAADLDRKNPRFQLRITALMPGSLMANITGHLQRYGADMFPIHEMAETIESGKQRRYPCLSEEENVTLHQGLLRCREIGNKLESLRVRTLVDAEYSWMNPAFNLVVMAMTLVHNRQTPLVWNTFQCYLQEGRRNIEWQYNFAKEHNICFGAKIVRGAYMAAELARAQRLDGASPLNPSFEATNAMYDGVVAHMIERVKLEFPRNHIVIAGHNKQSIKKAIKRMKELEIDPGIATIIFGQLYGMNDQISYSLGQKGYNVTKSVPYGSLAESLPYLSRRAFENRAILAGARDDLAVINAALKHRLKSYVRRHH